MATRRSFIKRVIVGFFAVGMNGSSRVLLSPASAGKDRIVVPRGTPRDQLVSKNPKDLDTSALDVTPLADFGSMGLDTHQVNLSEWRLRVEGQVNKPLSLSYEELSDIEPTERAVLLICPGIFVNHGLWKGPSTAALLRKAEVREKANYVTFRGPHGPYEKVLRAPVEDVFSGKVFLASTVNGSVLPQKHGFPLRLVAEGYYGHDWIKYVDKISADEIPN